jgi:hypothetical protein
LGAVLVLITSNKRSGDQAGQVLVGYYDPVFVHFVVISVSMFDEIVFLRLGLCLLDVDSARLVTKCC